MDVKLHPIQDASGEIRAFLEVMRKVSTGSTTPGGPELMGTSRPFNDAIGLLQRAAPSEVPVLLLGESGTGKELAAKALHQSSPRATKSFVPVACSGLTDALFESELFGHERGSFTGAHQRHIGLVESAQGGTLFLDEIGDVPLGMQVKLLRLLESRQFRRVGGTEPIRADFRLVCATHRPLEAMVEEGSFRHDLFYRINAFPVHLPSLRERTDDIELLATHFLPHHLRLDPQALQALEQHDYPGNIRELKNMLERAQILADGDWIRIEHLPASLRHRPPSAPPSATFDRVRPLHEAERSYLRWALEAHGGDRASLAEKLGISERTLYRKLASIDEV